MARINIEEKWKTDPRRKLLVKCLGSDRLADGMLVEIASLVLSHKGEGIPLAEFKFVENSDDWVACGLGCIDGDWVRIAGSAQYREFFEKQRLNGGKGGRPPKPTETQNNPPKPNHNPKKPSSSSSSSSSKENTEAVESAGAPAPAHRASLGGELSIVIPELSGNSRIMETVCAVPVDVQRDWVARWEPKSVKETLLNGINHYILEADGRDLAEIDNWGKLLSAWIRREKKTLIKRKPPVTPRNLEDPLPIKPVADAALASATAAKLGLKIAQAAVDRAIGSG